MKARFNHYFCWALGLAAVAASVVGVRQTLSATPVGPSAEQAAAEEPGVMCFGHVDVEEGVTALTPTQAGKVVEVPVKENEEVKAGAVLLRQDDRPARHRLAEAEQDLRAAEARLAQVRHAPAQHQSRVNQQQASIEAARHRLSAGEHALAQKQKLYRDNFVNVREVQTATEQLEELRSAVRGEQEKLRELQLIDPQVEVSRAEADVAARQARLEQAQWALAECVLRAPTDGTVLRILTRPGEVLSPLQPQSAVLFCPKEGRLIRVEVEQEFTARLAVGVAAVIQDDSPRPERHWSGKVVRVSDWYTRRRSVLQEPLQVNDVRTLECLVSIDDAAAPLRIGQRVRVRLLTPRG